MPRVNIGSFSLDIEHGWTIPTVILTGPIKEELAEESMLGIPGPEQFRQNVVITMEQVSPEETLETFIMKQLEGLRKANVARREWASERVKFENGLEGLLTEHVMEGPEGRQIRQMQLVAIKDGIAYTLIASDLDGPTYTGTRPRFRAMLLSFRPRPGAS